MLKGQLSAHNDLSSRVSRYFLRLTRPVWLGWFPMTDGWLGLRLTSVSALPFLCKGCQSQPLLLWFPAPSHPVLLPQLAPYASHMEKCHSPLTLLAAAKSSQVAISLSLLLSLCLSPSPLPTFFFMSLVFFCHVILSHYFTVCARPLE